MWIAAVHDRGTTKMLARLSGHIIVVQEQRFRLLADDGRGYLFTLGRGAGLQPADLIHLQEQQSVVEVLYDGRPNLQSGVACRVSLFSYH